MKGDTALIGELIKYERKKQYIKQSVLCKGICSPSYLCKIENNHVKPSPEIIDLLLNRLNISEKILQNNLPNYIELRNELLSYYKEITFSRNIDTAEKLYIHLIKDRNRYLNSDNYYDYDLLIVYILLVLKKPLKEIDKILLPLCGNELSFDPLQEYLLKKCMGIYNFNINKYHESIEFFNQALQILPQAYFNEFEKVDLNYMQALSKLSNREYVPCIEIIEQPYKYFLDNLLFARVIECLIIKGISYQKVRKFEKSIQIYTKALKISKSTGNEQFSAMIYQNIGSVYSEIGDLTVAIENYEKALLLKEKVEDQLLTIFSILQIHSRKNDKSSIIKWVNEGFKLLEERKDLRTYYFHFAMYQHLFVQFNENDLSFFYDAVTYFEEIKDFRHLYKYCIKIGILLRDSHKYKKASDFFAKAIYYKNINYLNWEDL